MLNVFARTGCLLVASALLPAGWAAGRRPMTPLDVVKLPTLDARKISPDGHWLLYAKSLLNWEKGERYTDLFVVRTDGSQRRRMTFTPEANETPFVWSRGSDAFAFLSERDGKKKQLYWMPLGGGEARRLTEENEGVQNFELSRDGRWLTYLAGPEDKRQLKLIDLSEMSLDPQPLTTHGTPVEEWKWHPGSTRILFTAADADESVHHRRSEKGFDVKINASPKSPRNVWTISLSDKQEERLTSHSDRTVSRLKISRDGNQAAYIGKSAQRYSTRWDDEVFLLDLRSGRSQRLTHNDQPESSFAFSPDSRWLAYTGSNESEQYAATKIYVVPTSGGDTKKLLAEWNYDGGISFWAPDNQSVYFAATVGVNQQIYRVSLSGAEPEPLTAGDHVLSATYDHDSKTLLISRTDPDERQDAFAAGLARLGEQSKWIRLTDMNETVSDFQLGEYETIRWKSTDGKQVEGLLIKPVGYEEGKRYPLIVQVHGGPAGTSTNRFSYRWAYYTHVFAGKGYALFQPNYRGSSGYGERFRRQIVGDYFRQGFEDIMSGVDHLIERGVADPDRLGHMGWSAGGHWSNWALTHTDRFKAISSGAGAVNWISMWAQSDMQINREFYFQGKPYENPEHYREVSPITYITNAKTPTLIMCGAADERVPNPQSRELYLSLQKLGVPVEYIEFPEMPHGITSPRYQLVKMEAELAWFDKWIHGKEGWIDWEKLLATLPKDSDQESPQEK